MHVPIHLPVIITKNKTTVTLAFKQFIVFHKATFCHQMLSFNLEVYGHKQSTRFETCA